MCVCAHAHGCAGTHYSLYMAVRKPHEGVRSFHIVDTCDQTQIARQVP